jgi:hypothetical protein
MRIEGYLNKGFKHICVNDQDLYIFAFVNSDVRKIDLKYYLEIKRR